MCHSVGRWDGLSEACHDESSESIADSIEIGAAQLTRGHVFEPHLFGYRAKHGTDREEEAQLQFVLINCGAGAFQLADKATAEFKEKLFVHLSDEVCRFGQVPPLF